MHQLPIAIPKRRPLRTGDHLIISKDRAQIIDRVLKNGGRYKIIVVLAILCKLQRAKNRIGIRGHITLEECLDRWWNEWRERDRWRISDSRRISDRGRQRNGRR